MLRAGLTLLVIVTGLAALACSSGGDDSPQPGSEDGSTRTASAGKIEVEATWVVSLEDTDEALAAYPLDRFLLFEVKLDTHSGDLGSIDLVKASTVETGADRQDAETWVPSSDGAHHRAGVLVFDKKAFAGPVTLVVDVGDGKAELVWDSAPG